MYPAWLTLQFFRVIFKRKGFFRSRASPNAFRCSTIPEDCHCKEEHSAYSNFATRSRDGTVAYPMDEGQRGGAEEEAPTLEKCVPST
jgi:hypothetical protein